MVEMHASQIGSIRGPGIIAETPFWYAMFSLCVQSDFPLPITQATPALGTIPDLVIMRADPSRFRLDPDAALVAETRCDCHAHGGRVVSRMHRGLGGAWLWNDGIGTCHIAPDARHVEVYPEADGLLDERALGLILAGTVATFILHQRGYPSLHASAVVTKRGAVAFLGPKGQGKSTMAAGFLQRDAKLLTDDILPLRQHDESVCGLPSLPIMKLWQESVELALALTDDLPKLADNIEKRLFVLNERYPLAQTLTRLRALYVLNRYDPRVVGGTDVVIRRLGQSESLLTLVAQASLREYLRPDEVAAQLPLFARLTAQAPVYMLHYPDGFEYQDRVYARIMLDLEEERR